MAETIESFVAKLQAEGVEAGRQEAERLSQEADKQAQEIVRQARREADKITADAKAEADDTLARARTELELAARDATLRLQEALGRALAALLHQQVRQVLEDDDFLGRCLHDIVMIYVKADFEQREVLKINVPAEMREKLISWALKEIGQVNIEKVRPAIDLKGTLADAGFEYTVAGSTIEVTRESVVEMLMELVGPGLRDVLQKTAAEPKE
jgi:vacuolar-type H+-ATPase subunit E/Vma4